MKANAVADAYKRLMFPALERDIRNELTESADEQAIKVFGVNLKTFIVTTAIGRSCYYGP